MEDSVPIWEELSPAQKWCGGGGCESGGAVTILPGFSGGMRAFPGGCVWCKRIAFGTCLYFFRLPVRTSGTASRGKPLRKKRKEVC